VTLEVLTIINQSFGHCIVFHAIYRLRLLIWYLQSFLDILVYYSQDSEV